mgnify:CR=1 FL=1
MPLEVLIPAELRLVLAEFKAAVADALGQRLAAVILFGSVACGRMSEESDIDLLVLVHACDSSTVRVVIDVAVRIMLARPEFVLSPLVLTTAQLGELRARERRLATDIDRDGVAL